MEVVMQIEDVDNIMQIKTGLPYDINQMTDISEHGAIIDMSNLNYPNINKEDNIRVTYIYLRNTGYSNIDLDFSNTEYSFKEQFLLYYLKGDIEYIFEECTNTWIKIIGFYNQQDFPIESILTNEEIENFIKNNKDYLEEINRFIISLPLYPISRLDFNKDEKLDFNEIETVEDKLFNNSICDIIRNQYFMFIYDTLENDTPVFYKSIFTEDNNELFDTILKFTPFSVLLYGMGQENWSEFVSDVENLITEK